MQIVVEVVIGSKLFPANLGAHFISTTVAITCGEKFVAITIYLQYEKRTTKVWI